jgi:hypothetical protein
VGAGAGCPIHVSTVAAREHHPVGMKFASGAAEDRPFRMMRRRLGSAFMSDWEARRRL